MKKIVRLTESDLTHIVKRVLNESLDGMCAVGNCKNGNGTWLFNNLDWKYTGQFKNGKPHGKGTESSVSKNISYTGDFVNGELNGYGEMKMGNAKYSGQITNYAANGYGKFTNKHGRVFSGKFDDVVGGRFVKSNDPINKPYEGLTIWDDLDDIKKDAKYSTTKCKQPDFSEENITWKYMGDKNYEYDRDPEGNCWWAKNVKNGKIFNLTDLVKTKPKIQTTIDRLNFYDSNKMSI
jgi:hypothetical protein